MDGIPVNTPMLKADDDTAARLAHDGKTVIERVLEVLLSTISQEYRHG
jgi:hypothetical protein